MPLRGASYLITITASGNPAVLPNNPRRHYLRVSSPASGAVYVSFGQQWGQVSSAGERLAPGQSPSEFSFHEIGSLIHEQVNIWNAGSGQTVGLVEGLE